MFNAAHEQPVILRTRIAHFKHGSGPPEALFRYLDDAVVVFERGKIALVGDAKMLAAEGFDLSSAEHRPDALLLSGFIDSHVHSSQLDVMGAYGEQLLDWLEQYTFPTEMRFADEAYARCQSSRFIDAMLANGTTSAMVFTTSHRHSADQLFAEAHRRNLRLIAGKVLMDRNGPTALLDAADGGYRDNAFLINKWHGKARLGYAVTPRFSITSSERQLCLIGQQFAEYSDLWVQTHLSENRDEIRALKSLFPHAKDYLATYQMAGLLNDRCIFAHGLHLTDDELKRLAEHGAIIAFCPSSNLFLGSGLFDIERISYYDIPVVLASDVGAGTQLSMFAVMGEAYKVGQLQGYKLSSYEAFYMCSAGAAKALKLDSYIGNLDEGKEADAILINPALHPFVARRLESCKSIEEELFVYMSLADERIIERSYIAGKMQYETPLKV